MNPSADMVFRVALGLVALVGLADSLIFGVNTLRRKETEVPCKDGSCVMLSRTPYARVFFRIPNWVFGIVFYALTVWAAVTTTTGLVGWAIAGSFVAFVLTLYLVWSLAIKLKVVCKLCYLAHTVNTVLLALWVWAMTQA